MTIRVAINGFGRIGRMVARCLAECPDQTLVAINALASPERAGHALRYDSVHGRFPYPVSVQGHGLLVNGDPVALFCERAPEALNWGDLSVDLVFECTGQFTSRARASGHRRGPRPPRVLVSAPCQEADATIAFGVNHTSLSPTAEIISAASCTTNCMAPLLAVLEPLVGIRAIFMTTVHAFTMDQLLLDGDHKDLRRARAAPLSMIPTSTGAMKALVEIFPDLAGKVHGAAMRVPVANVSSCDVTVHTREATSAEQVNEAFEKASQEAPLKNILAVNHEPLVSCDFAGHPASSILDAPLTHVVQDRYVRLTAWYDNEWGYANRLVDLAGYWIRQHQDRNKREA